MRRKLFYVGGALLALLAATVFFYLKSQAFMTTAASLLASEATKALNARVEVASVQVDSLRTAAARGVAVYDKQGKLLATAETVDVEFSLLGMARGGDPLGQIARVVVKDFAVQVERREDGVWNYSDFLDQDAKASAFRGEVALEGGAVAALFADKRVQLDQVAGTVDFAPQPAVNFALAVSQAEGAAQLSGTWGGAQDAVSVKAENINVERYLEFLPEEMAVKLQRGKIKSAEATFIKDGGDYKISGEALVLGAALAVEDTEIEEIDGLFLFDEKELRVFSRGMVQGEPIVLRGATNLDVAEPILRLRVSSPGFDAAKVLKNFPLAGKIAFDARVEGTFSDPLVDGRFAVAQGEIYGQTLRDVEAELKFSGGMLLVRQAKGKAFGGSIEGAGQIDADAQRYRMRVRASGLDAAALTTYIGDAAGSVDADVEIDGQSWELADAMIFGTVSATDGQVRQIAFTRADASFHKAGDDVRLDYLTVHLPRGAVYAEGAIGARAMQLYVQGLDVDLSQAEAINAQLQLSGTADFRAVVTGAPDNPEARAEFTAEKGAFFLQPYQAARGKMRLENRQLALESFAMEDGASSHEAHGFLRLDGAHELRLELVSRSVRAENILALVLPEKKLTGNVDNRVTITGTPEALQAEGEVDFHEGSFRGVLLTKAAGKYRYDQRGLVLQDFVVSSPNLRMQLSGALRAGEDLDFDFAADDIQVGKLRLQLPYPVSGTAKFAGKLRGKVSSPVFDGQLTADRLVFNGQELREVNGEVLYRENVVELTALGFKQGEGAFSMTAGADLRTERLYGNLKVAQGDLGAILALFNLETDWIGGKLDGTVTLSGTAKEPKVGLTGYMGEGHLKNYPLKNIALDIRLDGALATIRQFRAQQGDGLLVVKGSVDFNGPIAVEIAGQNIEAGLLTNLAAFDLDTKGLLNFGAQIGGTVQNPQANASITVEGGGVGTATFDTLYGMFKLEDGIIGVDQFLVQKGEYKASAYGIIPVAALTKSAAENAALKEQMDLRISLDQANLSILPFLSKEVEWATGDTQGGVNITGTLARPLVKGHVAIESGAIKFKALGHPVERMRLDLAFDGEHMALRTFEGAMGSGDYKLSGQARLTGEGLEDYAFTLALNRLDIDNAYYKGPLDGQLTLTSDTLRKRPIPKLAGLLHFENTTFDIPPIPEGETALPNMKLDVAVTLGKKVRLYNSFLYDIWLDGHVNFGGTTHRPKTTGEIVSVRGTVQYLKTPFKVKEATAYFNQVSSFLPSLRLEADTRLDRTKIYLGVDGPVEAMVVKLRSDPEMNESEILSLLTLRSRYKDRDGGDLGRDELVSLLDVGLRMSFLSELESMMRGALGVDEFRVVRDTLVLSDESSNTSDREVYNIEIGKYVSDKLMLRYTTGVDGDTYKFGVQYDFNNRISITGNIDEDNEPSIGIEARFKF